VYAIVSALVPCGRLIRGLESALGVFRASRGCPWVTIEHFTSKTQGGRSRIRAELPSLNFPKRAAKKDCENELRFVVFDG
jgi:hypothetical protein